MQVRAIYEDGQLKFQHPVRLKARRLVLEVTIPDNYILDKDSEVQQQEEDSFPVKGLRKEIEAITGQKATQSVTSARLDAILGKWRGHGGGSGKDVYKAMWHAHLEDKYLGER